MRKIKVRAGELTIGDAIAFAEIAEAPRPGADELRKLARLLVAYTDLTAEEVAALRIADLPEILEQFNAADEEVVAEAIPPE